MNSEGLIESIYRCLLSLSRERWVVFDTLLVKYGPHLLFRLKPRTGRTTSC